MEHNFEIYNSYNGSIIQRGFPTYEEADTARRYWLSELKAAYEGSKIQLHFQVRPESNPNRVSPLMQGLLF